MMSWRSKWGRFKKALKLGLLEESGRDQGRAQWHQEKDRSWQRGLQHRGQVCKPPQVGLCLSQWVLDRRLKDLCRQAQNLPVLMKVLEMAKVTWKGT